MIKHKSPFVVILIPFVLVFIVGAGQGEDTVAARPYPEQEPAGNSLTLTYIANMGVLLKAGDSRIMIDCLFDGPGSYRYPSAHTIDSIVSGTPPFDNIDLVLFTHKHQDHFDPNIVSRYMEINPDPILIAPADAVEEIRIVANGWSRIESRIVSIDLEIGEQIKNEVAGVPLTIVRTPHLGDKTPMNLMYLIEISGWRVFHEGDWSGNPDNFQEFGLDVASLDLAVIGYAWPVSPNPVYPRFLREVLKPRHIALGHVTRAIESVAEERINKVRKYYDDIFVLLPEMPTKIFRK